MRGRAAGHVPARPRLPAADDADDRRRLPVPAARPRPHRQLDHPAPADRRRRDRSTSRSAPSDLRPHPKGTAFSLIVDRGDGVGGELVWEETGTILRRGPGRRRPPPSERARAGGRRRAGDTSGGSPATSAGATPAVSGRPQPDPPASAQRQGPRLSRARSRTACGARPAASLSSRPAAARASRSTARFRKPILLPGTVGFAAVDRGDGRVSFAVRDSRPGRDGEPGGTTVHLQGGIVPAG